MRVNLGDNRAEDFSRRLFNIGEGKIEVQSSGNIKLLPDMCNLVSSIVELIQAVYPNVHRNFSNLDWLCERAIFCAKNEDVHQINSEILKNIPTEVKEPTEVCDTAYDHRERHQYATLCHSCKRTHGPDGIPRRCMDCNREEEYRSFLKNVKSEKPREKEFSSTSRPTNLPGSIE